MTNTLPSHIGGHPTILHYDASDPVLNARLHLPDRPYVSNEATIVPLAVPVVDYIHRARPDAVIAADRGGRLLALATHASWSHMYPGERFPTRDTKIHFARISTTLRRSTFTKSVLHACRRAGLEVADKNTSLADATEQNKGANILLIDDWVGRGSTFRRFHQTIKYKLGIPEENVALATMFGGEYLRFPYDIVHVRGDTRYPAIATGTDWGAYGQKIGITYLNRRRVAKATPKPRVSPESLHARRTLHSNIRTYHQQAESTE